MVESILVLLGKSEAKPKIAASKTNFINPTKTKQLEFPSIIEDIGQVSTESKIEASEAFDPFGFGSNNNANPKPLNSGFDSNLANVYSNSIDANRNVSSEVPTVGFGFVKKAQKQTDKKDQFEEIANDFTKLDIQPKEIKPEGFGFIKKKENNVNLNQQESIDFCSDLKSMTSPTKNASANENNSKKTVSIDDILSMAYGGDANHNPPPQNLQPTNYQVPLNFNSQPPQNVPSNYPNYMVYPQQPSYGYPQQQYQPQYQQPQNYGYPMYPTQQIPWQQGTPYQQPQALGYKAPVSTSDDSSNLKANDKLKDKLNFLDDMLKAKK